jgi:hypothetical protein
MHDQIKRAKMTPLQAKRDVKVDAEIGRQLIDFNGLLSGICVEIHLISHAEYLANHSRTNGKAWNNISGNKFVKRCAYGRTVRKPDVL